MEIPSRTLRELRDSLREGMELCQYGAEEMKYITKPIGRAVYENAYENKDIVKPKKEKKKNNRFERIECELCGRVISKNNKAAHRKTRYHQAFEKMNKKLREFLLDEKK